MKFLALILCIPAMAFCQSDQELNNKGVSFLDEEKYQEALVVFEKLVEKSPSTTAFRYNRAVSLFYLERYAESLNDYRILAREDGENSEYFFQIGNIMELLDRKDSVEFNYTVASQLDRENYLIYFKRGTYYLKNNEFIKAIADFNAAINHNPEHDNSYHNRGIALYKSGNQEKACDDWCTAATMGNASSPIHIERNCKTLARNCQPKNEDN